MTKVMVFNFETMQFEQATQEEGAEIVNLMDSMNAECAAKHSLGTWSWVCRSCNAEYSEISGAGITNNQHLQNGVNPLGHPLLLCGACRNVVDLVKR